MYGRDTSKWLLTSFFCSKLWYESESARDSMESSGTESSKTFVNNTNSFLSICISVLKRSLLLFILSYNNCFCSSVTFSFQTFLHDLHISWYLRCALSIESIFVCEWDIIFISGVCLSKYVGRCIGASSCFMYLCSQIRLNCSLYFERNKRYALEIGHDIARYLASSSFPNFLKSILLNLKNNAW